MVGSGRSGVAGTTVARSISLAGESGREAPEFTLESVERRTGQRSPTSERSGAAHRFLGHLVRAPCREEVPMFKELYSKPTLRRASPSWPSPRRDAEAIRELRRVQRHRVSQPDRPGRGGFRTIRGSGAALGLPRGSGGPNHRVVRRTEAAQGAGEAKIVELLESQAGDLDSVGAGRILVLALVRHERTSPGCC